MGVEAFTWVVRNQYRGPRVRFEEKTREIEIHEFHGVRFRHKIMFYGSHSANMLPSAAWKSKTMKNIFK